MNISSIGFSVPVRLFWCARYNAQPNSISTNSSSPTMTADLFSRHHARRSTRSPRRKTASDSAATTAQAKTMSPGVLRRKPKFASSQKTKPTSSKPAARASV